MDAFNDIGKVISGSEASNSTELMNLKAATWRLMYVGAVLCALICVAVVYKITVTGDASEEWIVWICVVLGFCLFGFGFVYEGRAKEQDTEHDALLHPDHKTS